MMISEVIGAISLDNAIFLSIGLMIGYTAGCAKAALRCAKRVQREVHEVHVELLELEDKLSE